MNYEEAQEAVKERRHKPVGFCPLINDTCNPKCVSFSVARVVRIDGAADAYYVAAAECTNLLITSEIVVLPK